MHTWLYRVNAVVTLSVFLLIGLSVLASLSERLHTSSPTVDLDLLDVEHFWRIPGGPFQGNDEAVLTLNITANLTSVFTWNTKQLFVFVTADFSTPKHPLNQVSLWDAIVERKEDAALQFTREISEYSLMDQGNSLRGLPFNLTVYWNVMPIVGGLSMDRISFSGFTMPPNYRPFHLPRDPSRFGAQQHHMHDMHFEQDVEGHEDGDDGEGFEVEGHDDGEDDDDDDS
ncbi:unnamed protein product [Closterium sp. NIES-65]|nr:unnamed protein product [Closterium sp. NIES-65]